MLNVTLINVKFPSSFAYFSSSSEDIQSTNSRCRQKRNIQNCFSFQYFFILYFLLIQ